MLKNSHEKYTLALSVSLIIWAIIALCFYQINKHETYLKFEITSSAIEFTFDLIFCVISWVLYKNVRRSLKKSFFILFLAILSLTLSEGGYLFAIYIAGLENQTPFYQALYDLPFIFFLLCQLIFLSSLVDNKIFHNSNKLYVGLFFIFNFLGMTIFMLATTAKTNYFSYHGAYDVITGIVEFIIFDLATLVLICAKNSGLNFICTGTIVLVASNLWEKYLFDTAMLETFDYSDMSWLLGQILMFFGIIFAYREGASFRIYSFKKIKNQISLWIFSMMGLCFLLLFSVGYVSGLINKNSMISLPFLMMTYAVIIVLFSSYVGTKFERPFALLRNDIDKLTNDKSDSSVLSNNLVADEFVFLQKFIVNAFKSQIEKNKEIQSLGNVALQVAHDIRSPVSAIMMLTKDCVEIPEVQRSALRDAANRIQDIANYLLGQHDNNRSESLEVNSFLASAAVLSVLSEKRIEYKNIPITFSYDALNNSCFAFIQANIIEFKRAISNIINNAVDAISGEGKVSVKLIDDRDCLTIAITDTGRGMPIKVRNEILNNEMISSHKSAGHGFGLTHARATLESCGAKLEIQSDANNGTELNLIFKKNPCPIWITEEIQFYSDDCIVILDDDSSIHCAWDKFFAPLLASNSNLKIAHFTEAQACLDFIKSHPVQDELLLLVDYELLKQKHNGLDVIEISGIERAILVTSHYENNDIIKRAILLKTKILPKILASSVKLTPTLRLASDTNSRQDVDLVLLENNQEFSSVLSYLYSAKNKKLNAYHNPYDLLENISSYSKHTKICLDFSLDCMVNGVELAKLLHEKGYTNLYLATGFKMQQAELPSYLTLLNEKMDLLNL